MYVRKFEADTLDEALKDIKRELGPDAIILKTITNKGIKGAFKKKRIEITAAISEKNYTKKAHVDRGMDESSRENFYNGPASKIANMIDNHSANNKEKTGIPSYGHLGLNRQVSTTKNLGEKIKGGLDDFLKLGTNIRPNKETPPPEEHSPEVVMERVARQAPERVIAVSDEESPRRIDELERRLYEMVKEIERLDRRGPIGIYHLTTTLRGLGIDESFIQDISRKALFELSEQELEDVDIVFEFALREMLSSVAIGMPLFSSLEGGQGPVITILISETSNGQTCMARKLVALKKDMRLIRSCFDGRQTAPNFSEKLHDMEVVTTANLSELVAECRKATDSGHSVLVDLKVQDGGAEAKKCIDGLRRSFGKMEVLVSLSAIHSGSYNRKMVAQYGKMSDGLVLSHLDLCLDFGALFNVARTASGLPFKFYGTGPTVPDDIEAATAERLLAGIFRLG